MLRESCQYVFFVGICSLSPGEQFYRSLVSICPSLISVLFPAASQAPEETRSSCQWGGHSPRQRSEQTHRQNLPKECEESPPGCNICIHLFSLHPSTQSVWVNVFSTNSIPLRILILPSLQNVPSSYSSRLQSSFMFTYFWLLEWLRFYFFSSSQNLFHLIIFIRFYINFHPSLCIFNY